VYPFHFSNFRISMDIMPTICAALGVDLPKDRVYDGKNILPAIKGKLKKPLHDELYWDGNDNRWAVRQGDMKLVCVKNKYELYDLKADIGEKNDLAAKYPEKVDALKKKYESWRNEMGTPMGDSIKKKK